MKKLNHCPMSIRVATLRSRHDDDEEEEEEEEKCIRRLCSMLLSVNLAFAKQNIITTMASHTLYIYLNNIGSSIP